MKPKASNYIGKALFEIQKITKGILTIALRAAFYLKRNLLQRETRIEMEDVRRILIVHIGKIGDSICLLQTLLKKEDVFPNSTVDILASPAGKSVFDCFSDFDTFLWPSSLLGKISMIMFLYRRNYELVMVFDPRLPCRLVALLVSRNAFLGYATTDEIFAGNLPSATVTSIGINCKPMRYHLPLHIHDRHFLVLKSVAPHLKRSESRRRLSPRNVESPDLDGIKIPDRYIVLQLGAGNLFRAWPVQRFADLIQTLWKYDPTVFVILSGTKREKPLAEVFMKEVKSDRVIDLSGDLTLKQMISLIKSSYYFLGNDSGPVHVADTLHIPTLCIMGPNRPEIAGPYSPVSRVAYIELSCSPCTQKYCVNEELFRCLNDVSVEYAFSLMRENYPGDLDARD